MGVDESVCRPTAGQRHRWRATAAILWAIGLAACSSRGSGPGAPVVDAGGASPDAGANYAYGAPLPDAASCPSSAASACNTIPNVGTPVPTSCSSDAPPAMTGGGPIADGTYVLTAQAIYNSSCTVPPGEAYAQTVLITGLCGQVVTGLGDDAGHSTVALASAAGELTLGQICPALDQGTYGYTATATTLTLSILDPTGYVVVTTYTRQ